MAEQLRASSPSATGRTCARRTCASSINASRASLADDVRYLGSVLIREDEVVLCHFEGTADAIRRVAERASVPVRAPARSHRHLPLRGKDAAMKGKLIRPAFVALAIVGIALVAGGIAYAAIPDGSGVIHGCYQKNQGTLRVIDTDTTQTCSSSESPLTWSQTGPQGTAGAARPAGAAWADRAFRRLVGRRLLCEGGARALPFQTRMNLATTSMLPDRELLRPGRDRSREHRLQRLH